MTEALAELRSNISWLLLYDHHDSVEQPRAIKTSQQPKSSERIGGERLMGTVNGYEKQLSDDNLTSEVSE